MNRLMLWHQLFNIVAKRSVLYLEFFKNGLHILYAVILAVVSFFTGEIITFIMLGFILMALLTINETLKKILKKLSAKGEGDE